MAHRWLLALAIVPQLAAAQATLALRPEGSGVALTSDYRLYRSPQWTVLATGVATLTSSASSIDSGQSGSIEFRWQPTPSSGMGLFASLGRLNFEQDRSATTLQYTRRLARLWSLVAAADYASTRSAAYASAQYGCRLALQGPLLRRLSASIAYARSRLAVNQDPLVGQETLLLSLSYLL